MAHTACLLLGTNLGDRSKNLQKARKLLEEHVGGIIRRSAIYETAAWGVTDQPVFWNEVLSIATELPPELLLKQLQIIEAALGRERYQRWTARILDIDILYYENVVVQTETLTIPHPQIAFRRFTLVPLAELAPDYVHPLLNKTNQELLLMCTDELSVRKVEDEVL